jgi:hypothetical protein
LSFIDGLIIAREQLQGTTVTNEAEVPEVPAGPPATPAVPSGYAQRRKPTLPQLFITSEGKLALGIMSFPLKKDGKNDS